MDSFKSELSTLCQVIGIARQLELEISFDDVVKKIELMANTYDACSQEPLVVERLNKEVNILSVNVKTKVFATIAKDAHAYDVLHSITPMFFLSES